MRKRNARTKVGQWTIEVAESAKTADGFDLEAWLAKLIVRQWLEDRRAHEAGKPTSTADSDH